MNKQADEIEQYQQDISYAESHHEELLKQYPEQWAAILHQKVVGAAPDVYQLIAELQERGLPTERVVLRHLTRREELLIL